MLTKVAKATFGIGVSVFYLMEKRNDISRMLVMRMLVMRTLIRRFLASFHFEVILCLEKTSEFIEESRISLLSIPLLFYLALTIDP